MLSAVITTSLLLIGWPTLTASAADGPNIAAGRPATASTAHAEYPAGNITDGNQGTYWQSAQGGLPQWVQTDLGATSRVDEVVLKLPAGWESRSQTLSVQGSADGTSFTTIKTSAAYSFQPGSGNTVTVGFPATQTRFVRVHITANTGWAAAQLSELEVHAAGESSVDLARGKTLTASSHTEVYTAANANDGNKGSYWESANGSLPQWIQRRPRRVRPHRPRGTAAAGRLAEQNADPPDPGQRQRHRLHGPDRLQGVRLQRGRRAVGDDHLRRRHHPVRAGPRHRQLRQGGSPAVRAGDLRTGHRGHAGSDRAHRTRLHGTGHRPDQADLEAVHRQHRA